jgi:hypothetical protein
MSHDVGVMLLRRTAAMIYELVHDLPVKVALFPAMLYRHETDDRLALQEVHSALIECGLDRDRLCLVEWTSLDQAACWLQAAALVCGNRLHPLLVASLANTPLLGIGPPGKIRACLEEIGDYIPRCVVLNDDLRLEPNQKRLLRAALVQQAHRRGQLSLPFNGYRQHHLANVRLLLDSKKSHLTTRSAA